jgi:hypothetical protein
VTIKEKMTMAEANTLTTRQTAQKLGTDPRTLRRFLRSDASGRGKVGKGKRYEFTAPQVPALKKKFAAWAKSDQAKPRQGR